MSSTRVGTAIAETNSGWRLGLPFRLLQRGDGTCFMKEFDMHLAAATVSRETVARLFDNGFERDEFANLTYCHTGDYHGTFRGTVQLPDENLWNRICGFLDADQGFSGYLEEELCDDAWRRNLASHSLRPIEYLPSIDMITCPAGRRKACDIHMAVYVDSTPFSAVEYMRRLGCASVDRVGPEGIRRVYTITCESLADGRRLFTELHSHLAQVPGLHGRMKLEVTTRHYRKPADAMTLPIATSDGVAAWFAKLGSKRMVSSERYQSASPELYQPTRKRDLAPV